MIQLQATEQFTTTKLNLTSNLCEVCEEKGIKQRTMIFQGEEVCVIYKKITIDCMRNATSITKAKRNGEENLIFIIIV